MKQLKMTKNCPHFIYSSCTDANQTMTALMTHIIVSIMLEISQTHDSLPDEIFIVEDAMVIRTVAPDDLAELCNEKGSVFCANTLIALTTCNTDATFVFFGKTDKSTR